MDENDVTFEHEINALVASLPVPTEEQIAGYAVKMAYMESIHDEIRSVNRDFMPVYDPMDDLHFPVGNKYLEIVYNYSYPERED